MKRLAQVLFLKIREKVGFNRISITKMKKFYQVEWHDIYFKDFGTSTSEVPEKDFYDKFYERFFKKYRNFDGLDTSWVAYKMQIARRINAILKTKTNVLSIGSGIGIVEDLLTNLNSNVKIMSIEPSENASRWVRDNPNICIVDGYFPECIDKGLNFELVYANNIDYVFDDEEYKDFLKSVVDYGVSEFLIITSANYNLKVALKLFIKEILGVLGIIEKLADGQFWGYLRSKSEHKKALKHVGFREIKFSKLGKDTVLIRSKI